jgi:hypothetical protein
LKEPPGSLPPEAPPVLVLARREGERIRIGHDVIVSVLEVRGSGVIFSVDAPPHLAIITPSARTVPKQPRGGRPRED